VRVRGNTRSFRIFQTAFFKVNADLLYNSEARAKNLLMLVGALYRGDYTYREAGPTRAHIMLSHMLH
jgi:hypothetical protein